ncbi:hypothetical protein ACA910_005985 [Epithemia clementina (nom. ined.)]
MTKPNPTSTSNNSSCSDSSTKDSRPKLEHHHRKFRDNMMWIVDGTAVFFSGLMPQGVELRMAERQEARRQRAEVAAAQEQNAEQHSDAASATNNNLLAKEDEKATISSPPESLPQSPRLLTADRISSKPETTQVWQCARHILFELLNFHMFWSYLVVAMLILHPFATILATVGLTITASAICALLDLVWSFVQGNDTKALSQQYIDFAKDKWRSFRKGEGRRFTLIVIGIIMNPKSQQKAQTSRYCPPPLRKPRRPKHLHPQQEFEDGAGFVPPQ